VEYLQLNFYGVKKESPDQVVQVWKLPSLVLKIRDEKFDATTSKK
jgi:hypothetical protein